MEPSKPGPSMPSVETGSSVATVIMDDNNSIPLVRKMAVIESHNWISPLIFFRSKGEVQRLIIGEQCLIDKDLTF